MTSIRRHDLSINPLVPRLWGRTVDGVMSAGAYDMWVVRSTLTSIRLEPNLPSYRVMTLIMLAVTLLAPAILVYIIAGLSMRGLSEYAPIALAIAIPLALPTFMLYLAGNNARRRGPLMEYDLPTGFAKFPRFGLSTRRSRPIRIDLIRSKWTKQGRRSERVSTELHLVIERRSGRVISVPILGTRAIGKRIARVADGLGAAMKIPVIAICDTNDYQLLAVAYLNSRCFKCKYSLVGNVSGVCPECGTPMPPVHFEVPITRSRR
jgi:hypothetical protein